MNQVSRNIGHEPRPHTVHDQWLDPHDSRRASTVLEAGPRPGEGGPSALRGTAWLAAWPAVKASASLSPSGRAGYDPSLAKKISKEEKDGTTSEKVEEPRTLLQRWLNPKKDAEAKDDDSSKLPSSKSPSTLILGSDGWRPMLKPEKNPEAEKEFDEAHKLFQQGKLAEAEDGVQEDREEAKRLALGREVAVLRRRDPVPAEEVRQGQRQLRAALRRLSRHRVPRQAGQPRVLARPDVALAKRSQGSSPSRSCPGTPISPASSRSSTPRERD